MKFKVLTLVLMGVIVASCAKNLPPDLSPEAKVAVHGERIVKAVRAVLPSIKILTCTTATQINCLKVDDALKVTAKLQEAVTTAEQLGQALVIVDSVQPSEKDDAMGKAQALLANLQTLLNMASVAPENEPARQELVKLFSTITSLLFAVNTF